MKTIGLAVIWTLALCGACGGDDGGGTARAAACKPFIEQAKKCDAVVDCEDEKEANCLKKYPKALCSDGSAFDSYLACLAGSK